MLFPQVVLQCPDLLAATDLLTCNPLDVLAQLCPDRPQDAAGRGGSPYARHDRRRYLRTGRRARARAPCDSHDARSPATGGPTKAARPCIREVQTLPLTKSAGVTREPHTPVALVRCGLSESILSRGRPSRTITLRM